MSLALPEGTIREDSPRAETWKKVFGSLTIPLKSPIPVTMDGDGGPKRFFLVDLKRLTETQKARVIAHVAEKYDLDPATVAEDLESEHGLPILDQDVFVSFDPRLVL